MPVYITMFTVLFIALVASIALTVSQDLRSPMDRMSLAFGVANKPYPPIKKPKGKGTKDKFMHLMARAKYAGTGVVGLSGKINGTVFLSNGVVRVWKKPNNVRNAFTQLVRGIFSGTSTAWKTLTESEILSWTSSSALYFSKKTFGTAYSLKGNAIFQRVNNILVSLGRANMSTCPGVATPALVITSSIAGAAAGVPAFSSVLGDFSGAVVIPANSYIKVYATRQVDIGVSSFGNSAYRYIGFFPPTTSIAPLNILADYTARFGTLVAGQRIGIAFEVISTNGTTTFGKSGRFYDSVVVAP